MKIYTRTGDGGETGLLGGHRVSKSDQAVSACGDLDETCAALGLALSLGMPEQAAALVSTLQQDLFVVGAHVAASRGTRRKLPAMDEGRVAELERWIDRLEEGLPPLDAFILPGGVPAGAALHLARAICRRAERSLVKLLEAAGEDARLRSDLVYLNRLADLLFVLARHVNWSGGAEETRWLPGNGS